MLRFKKTTPTLAAPRKDPSVRQVWHPERTRENFASVILNATVHSNNPLDVTLRAFAEKENVSQPAHPPMLTLPFNQQHGMSGNIWHHGAEYKLFVEGSPEQVLARCDLTDNEHERALTEQHKLMQSNLSVFAFAHVTLPGPISSLADVPKKARFTFDGLVALENVTSTDNNT